jgi:hypothetical protein
MLSTSDRIAAVFIVIAMPERSTVRGVVAWASWTIVNKTSSARQLVFVDHLWIKILMKNL